jgi:(p)ppGpp synthase/HD superfamily hydrolase|tara:strand:+ start:1213 stop:1722 length:510 start_codon:yes stop_codon:yes gene_type:complete
MDEVFIEKAKEFARVSHAGQVRKYTGLPYVTHTEEVADIVRSHNGSKEMIAAALLHDVVEDTNVTNDEIRVLFGNSTADMVKWLTDTSKPGDGNRTVRKGIDRDRLSQASAAAQLIKAADMISNGKDIKVNDPKFAVTYIAEMDLLLKAMTKIHLMDIYKQAQGVVNAI